MGLGSIWLGSTIRSPADPRSIATNHFPSHDGVEHRRAASLPLTDQAAVSRSEAPVRADAMHAATAAGSDVATSRRASTMIDRTFR